MSDTLQMLVSPICVKDGDKFAYVEFKDDSRYAEGKIPQCEILKSKGFSKDEVDKLEEYMKANLKDLKKMAASNNLFEALKR